MALSLDLRTALGPGLWFLKRLRRFWDAEARNRDLQLNHSLVNGLRDVRAELSSLGVEQDVSAQQVESLGLAIAHLEQEVQRLRATLASLPVAVRAPRGRDAQALDLGGTASGASTQEGQANTLEVARAVGDRGSR